jgi:hypothetical protein
VRSAQNKNTSNALRSALKKNTSIALRSTTFKTNLPQTHCVQPVSNPICLKRTAFSFFQNQFAPNALRSASFKSNLPQTHSVQPLSKSICPKRTAFSPKKNYLKRTAFSSKKKYPKRAAFHFIFFPKTKKGKKWYCILNRNNFYLY